MSVGWRMEAPLMGDPLHGACDRGDKAGALVGDHQAHPGQRAFSSRSWMAFLYQRNGAKVAICTPSGEAASVTTNWLRSLALAASTKTPNRRLRRLDCDGSLPGPDN